MTVPTPPSEITRLVSECASGDKGALDRLFALIYDDLRAIAHRQLQGEAASHTLNTTALVHEAYLRLVDQARSDWRDRAHFFAVASGVMRHVLVDYARRRGAGRRGGGRIQVPLRDHLAVVEADAGVDLIVLDKALTRLSGHDERMGRVVEYRFFGGMSVEDTAKVLGVSTRTVERAWTRAKAYLYRQLSTSTPAGES